MDIDEIIEIWEDVLERAEKDDYELKSLVSEFLEHLHALEG